MRDNGWRAKAAKKFKATTNSNHQLPVAPNLLQQNFFAYKPNEKWVSDITYCWTEEGWLYLDVVMNLYSRKVVGWAMSERMTKKLVIAALQMAVWSRKPPRGLIIHSDRGSQYCSQEYQKILNLRGLVCSMSKRGDCYDNAAMESWNHSFKVEAIHGERFATRDCVKNMCSNILKFITIESDFIRCWVINHLHLLKSKNWLSKVSDFPRQDDVACNKQVWLLYSVKIPEKVSPQMGNRQ